MGKGLPQNSSLAEEETTAQKERLSDSQEALLIGNPEGFYFLLPAFVSPSLAASDLSLAQDAQGFQVWVPTETPSSKKAALSFPFINTYSSRLLQNSSSILAHLMCWSILPHMKLQTSDLCKHMSSLASNMCFLQNVASSRVALMLECQAVQSLLRTVSWGSVVFGCLSNYYLEPQFLLLVPPAGNEEIGFGIVEIGHPWKTPGCYVFPELSVQMSNWRSNSVASEYSQILTIFQDSAQMSPPLESLSGLFPPQSWTSPRASHWYPSFVCQLYAPNCVH